MERGGGEVSRSHTAEGLAVGGVGHSDGIVLMIDEGWLFLKS